MTPSAGESEVPAASGGNLARLDAELLRFVAEMHGVQVDQLAALVADRAKPADEAAVVARELVASWRAAGNADTGQLSLGEPWVWATRKGLDACGLKAKLVKPSPRALRHTHAVTDVRIAVERADVFREGGAWWRPERLIWSGLEFPIETQHVPDGELHWPDGSGLPWAGEVWAVEVEISHKTIETSARIMQEVLTQTGASGGVPAGGPGPALAPRYARLVYVCSSITVRRVLHARAEVGSPLSARIDIYDLPVAAIRFQTPKRGWQS
jgi:hypothetical protein